MPFGEIYVDPRQPADPFRHICRELGRMRAQLYCYGREPHETDVEAFRTSLRERCLGELKDLAQTIESGEKAELLGRIATFAHELGAHIQDVEGLFAQAIEAATSRSSLHMHEARLRRMQSLLR